jgi:SSS family solute:Na+ symporter
MYLTAVLIYLGVLVLIGFWQSRRVKSGADFLVAGRTLPARVLVFTLLATWIGSGSLFGGAGLGYRAGFPALWQSAGAWVGIAAVYFLAHRVRRIAKFTMPDILELRYGPIARVLGTIVTGIAYTTIAAYQFRGGGRLLSLISTVDPNKGALITAVFCILYTALAGMLSVAYLDVGNGLMMIVGVGAAVVYLIAHAGGFGDAFRALRPDQVSVLGTFSLSYVGYLFLPTMFLLLGEANMYQKFFSARDERAARNAVIGWIVGTIVVETLIDSVGVFGSVVLPGLSQADSEVIVMRVAVDHLPAVLGIGLVCGAAAIIISTANSFLLTPASALMNDLYRKWLNPAATDRQMLLWTRVLVVVLGALGFISLQFWSGILEMALWAYTVYGAGVTPALLAAFFWPRATTAGAVASMVMGTAVTVGWETYAKMAGGVYPLGLEAIFPALLASVLALVLVSFATPAPSEQQLAATR